MIHVMHLHMGFGSLRGGVGHGGVAGDYKLPVLVGAGDGEASQWKGIGIVWV